MVGKFISTFLFIILLAQVNSQAFKLQLIGVTEDKTILAGQSFDFEVTDQDLPINTDSIEFSYYPEWAATVSQNQVSVLSNFIGKLSLTFTYGQQTLQEEITVNALITRSNRPFKLAIDSAFFISLNTSQLRQSDTLSLLNYPLNTDHNSELKNAYEIVFKNTQIDSFQLSNESNITRSVWSQDSLGNWILVKTIPREQSLNLSVDQPFALALKTSSSKTTFTVSPMSFSPYFSQRGKEPGTEFIFENKDLNTSILFEINIYNSDGFLVRQFYRGFKNKNLGQDLVWFYDGLDDKKRALRNGRYRAILTYEIDGKERRLYKDFGVFK